IRNGVRAIAEGTGDFRRLSLRYVSPTVDIKEDDILVSSGLGGRFPSGYPVGTVIGVSRDPGQPFMTVDVEPAAHNERSRHLLLVFSEIKDFPAGADQSGLNFGVASDDSGAEPEQSAQETLAPSSEPETVAPEPPAEASAGNGG